MNEEYSLNLEFSQANLTEEEKRFAKEKISALETPFFAKYSPECESIKEVAKKYKNKKNIIIEANGGSISTIRAFSSCFSADTDKNVFILDTDDPDYIAELKKKCKKEDTLLMIINRSGNSIQTISGYLLLPEYETIFITIQGSTLFQIGQAMDVPTCVTSAEDQPVSRFSGISEFHFIPAAILGIDIEGIAKGAQKMYARCAPDSPSETNPALQFALHLDKLEKLGYTELFLSIYSKKLWGFSELFVQLFHESVCKNGKGQTIYGSDAPENQHHTLQRFNSGRKNSVAFFMTVENFQNDFAIKVPEAIKDIRCRNIDIATFEKLSAADVIHTEFEGTWKDTIEEKNPVINLQLKEVSPSTAGMLVAFFQYAAYYSSILRDVNPFDQPGVEKSKEYIFQLVEDAE
ncbi:MAG: hypothetical protein WCQ96_05335 [Patescibacteria group bacterium]